MRRYYSMQRQLIGEIGVTHVVFAQTWHGVHQRGPSGLGSHREG